MDDTHSFPAPDARTSPLAPVDERKGSEFSPTPGMPNSSDARSDSSAPPEADTLAELENLLHDIRQELPPPLPPQTEPDTLAELTSVLEDIRQESPAAKFSIAADAAPPPPNVPQGGSFSQDMSSTLQELTSILTELTGTNPVGGPSPAAPAPLNPSVPSSPPPPGNPSVVSPRRAASGDAATPNDSTLFPIGPAGPSDPAVPPARPWGNNRPRPPRHGVNTPAFTGRNPLGDEHLLLPPDVLDFIPESDTSDATPEWDVPSVPVAMDLPPEISWDSLWEDKPTEGATSALPDDMPLRSFIPPEDLLDTEDRENGLPADMPPPQTTPVFPPAGQPVPDVESHPAETARTAMAPRTPAQASALSHPADAAITTAKAAAIPSAVARERIERREAREQARKERRQRQLDTAAHAAPQPLETPAARQSVKQASRQPEDQTAMDTLSELRKLLSTIAVPPSGSAGGNGSSGKPDVKPPVSPWRQPVRGPLPLPRRPRSSAEPSEQRRRETPEANAGPLASRDVWRAPRPAAGSAKPSDRTASPIFPIPDDAALLFPPKDLDTPPQPASSPLLDLTGIAQAMNLEFHAARNPDPASDIFPILLPVPDAEDRPEPLPASPEDAAPVAPAALSAPAVEIAPSFPSNNAEDASETTTMTTAEAAKILPPDAADAPSAALPETPPAKPEAVPEGEPVDAAIPPTPATEQELPPGWLNRLGQRLRRVFRPFPPDGHPKTNRPPLRVRTDDLNVTLSADTVLPPVEPSEAAPAPVGLMQRLREMEAEHRQRLRALSERPRGPVYPSAEARSHLLRYSLAADEPAPARRRRLTDDDFSGVPGTGPIHVLRDKPTAWERFFRALRAKMGNESFRQGVRTAAFYTAVLAALGGALYASSHPEQVEQAVHSLLRMLP